VTAVSAAARMPRFNLIKQMSESKAVIGLNMLRLWDEAGTLQAWIDPLAELLQDGTIRPVVAEAVPFAQAPRAHRLLAERANVGKVVLVP
jgi:NADPH:quinone reductase-like Zn-dependent oxidoreductase